MLFGLGLILLNKPLCHLSQSNNNISMSVFMLVCLVTVIVLDLKGELPSRTFYLLH